MHQHPCLLLHASEEVLGAKFNCWALPAIAYSATSAG